MMYYELTVYNDAKHLAGFEVKYVSYDKPKKEYKPFTDAQLANMVKNGDELAFEEIVVRYIRLIASIASKYRATSYDVNDFVQEGLLVLLKACKTYNKNSGSSFKNYAALCVENKFISILRKSQIKSAIPKESMVPIDQLELSDDNTNNPEEMFLEKDFLKNISLSLQEKLSLMEREVFSFYIAGCSYEEIATKMDINVKSVDNALQRIRRKLN